MRLIPAWFTGIIGIDFLGRHPFGAGAVFADSPPGFIMRAKTILKENISVPINITRDGYIGAFYRPIHLFDLPLRQVGVSIYVGVGGSCVVSLSRWNPNDTAAIGCGIELPL